MIRSLAVGTWLTLRRLLVGCALVAAGALAPIALAQAADAAGDGSLRPPTAPRYADPAWYDIVDVHLLEGDPIRVRVTLGAVDDSAGLALGISQPIIEIYLDTEPGGAEALLPGSGLQMPLGEGWQLALRLTGDGAWGWLADATGEVDLAAPRAVEVLVEGRTLTVLTPFPRPEEPPRIYAISGVYDPFRPDGWRPLTREPSAWAFSSPTQTLPVVDVYPSDPDTRAAALARGELPRIVEGVAVGEGAWLWLALMAVGLALAIAGLVERSAPRRRRRVAASAAATPASAPELIADAELSPSLLGLQPERSESGPGMALAKVSEYGSAAPAAAPVAVASGPEAPETLADADPEPEPAAGTDPGPADATGTSDTAAPSDARREAKRS